MTAAETDMRDFEILGETDDWLILDKPVGVSVHNRQGEDLVSFMKERLGTDKVFLVNRLDSGTCGLVLFAKHSQSAKTLQQSFEKRLVSKTYLARVQVLKNQPVVGESGLWRWPLTNRTENRRDPKGFGGKRIPCQTQWKVLDVAEDRAILSIDLLTGRKHQIRRHCAIQGWPVWGDPRYGIENPEPVEGHHLIAKELSFNDPKNGDLIIVRSKFEL